MKEITKELVMNSIPERKTESHKGDFGKVLIIAGSRTMTGDCAADAVTASGAFCALRRAANCIPAALTARIPKNNALLVTIFLVSGFIHITSGLLLVKVYVRGQGNMTHLETWEYIKQLFRIKICKGGAAAPSGKGYGIEAYPAVEDDDVRLDPDRSGEMVPAGRRENA